MILRDQEGKILPGLRKLRGSRAFFTACSNDMVALSSFNREIRAFGDTYPMFSRKSTAYTNGLTKEVFYRLFHPPHFFRTLPVCHEIHMEIAVTGVAEDNNANIAAFPSASTNRANSGISEIGTQTSSLNLSGAILAIAGDSDLRSFQRAVRSSRV